MDDFAAWRAVDRGERQVDWSVWFGPPDDADYLTATGKELIPRMVSDLTTFFGTSWLHRALYPDGVTGRQRVAGLGRSAPSLAPARMLRPGAFIESVRWWAALQLLESIPAAGVRSVRSQVRNDVTASRFLHTLTQARLGAIGAFCGAEVILEPAKTGGPGDVLLKFRDTELFIEVVTFSPDRNFAQQDEYFHRHTVHLHWLEGVRPVHFEGDVPGFLTKIAEERWRRDTEEAAARCAATGQAVEVFRDGDRRLVVKPGAAPRGTGLTGPGLESDQSRRLLEIVRKKGGNTRGAGLAWIWVEDHGGLHPTSAFFNRPLVEQLAAMRDATRPVFDDYRHVAGIIYSYAHQRRAPLPPDELAERPGGYAFQRGLPIDRVRRTFVTTRRIELPTPTNYLIKMCDQEGHWLDWALRHLGIVEGVGALLITSAQTSGASARLWRPR